LQIVANQGQYFEVSFIPVRSLGGGGGDGGWPPPQKKKK